MKKAWCIYFNRIWFLFENFNKAFLNAKNMQVHVLFCCVINLYGWREDALHEMTPVSLGTLSLSPFSTIYPWVFLLAHLSWKSFLITSCTNVHLSLSSSHFQLLPETLDWFQPNLAKSIFEWIAFKFIQMQHQAFQREDWMFWKSYQEPNSLW